MKHKDKLLHIAVCFVATLFSVWLAIGLAIGKEYGDSKAHGNRWSWGDIVADAIGIALALLVKFLFGLL